MSIVKPLYGHTSEDTAYLVLDYPYGFKLRCSIRYWLESHPIKGFRFVSQTTNPKKGNVWNSPKKSTYSLLAACMYLDENNHVKWTSIHEYTSAEYFLTFLQNFPEIQLSDEHVGRLKYWTGVKIAICKTKISSKAIISISGVPQLPTEQDIEKAKQELEVWEKASSLIKWKKKS